MCTTYMRTATSQPTTTIAKTHLARCFEVSLPHVSRVSTGRRPHPVQRRSLVDVTLADVLAHAGAELVDVQTLLHWE